MFLSHGWYRENTMQVSSKMRRGTDGYLHYCEACDEMHPLPDRWSFDGNLEAPTFSPSFRHSHEAGPDGIPAWCCHYILTNGVVNYCGDCTHAMAGRSVPMADLPVHLQDEGKS